MYLPIKTCSTNLSIIGIAGSITAKPPKDFIALSFKEPFARYLFKTEFVAIFSV